MTSAPLVPLIAPEATIVGVRPWQVAIVKVLRAALRSLLPAVSTAPTWNVWVPSARSVKDLPLLGQVLALPPSMLHSKWSTSESGLE